MTRVRLRSCLCVLSIALGGAGCHEDSGVAVSSLTFEGNRAFPTARLKAVLATRQSGWLPWSPKHYFDRAEFERDAKRLQAFYADRGYPDMRIAGVDVKLNDKKDKVALTVHLDEGQPVIVDAVRFEGFDLPAEIQRALDTAPIKAGQPRDRELVRSTRDLGARLLRDNGYPHAKVEVTEQVAADPKHTSMTVRAEPGVKTYVGETTMTGLESVGENVVRRELTFHTGDLYKESELTRSQQRLVELGLFDFAHVGPASEDTTAPTMPLKVTLAEGRARELRLSGGYGSEERLRGTVRWSHLNFLGGARHATADAKYSAIDRGVKLSFIAPYFVRRGFSLNVSGTAWRTNQLSYDTSTFGGRTTLSYHSDTGLTGLREPIHREVRIGYLHEYLRYGITNPEDETLHSERIALGLDPESGRSAGTLSALDIDLERVAVDDALNPRRGTITSVHLENAFRFLRGAYHYQELMFEGRIYWPLTRTIVWANRARIGTLFAGSVSDMPFSARYFLGGSTSVRGWGRYEISPLNSRGLPIGGRSLLEISTELRFPLRGKLSGVAFVDAGQVGAESVTFDMATLRYAAGPGLRYLTPIGAVRADLGVQLNRVPGLVINGKDEQRHWRVHFSIGQAF